VEEGGTLALRCKPTWHENSADNQLRFLQRIAIAGTRHLNRQLEINFDLVQSERQRGM
jgi:predicted SprT family Zn-dependent metalloprotease